MISMVVAATSSSRSFFNTRHARDEDAAAINHVVYDFIQARRV